MPEQIPSTDAAPILETADARPLKPWVAPTFEQTPLNEAMAGATTTASATDAGTGYS